jgi:hypothetical protein
MCCDTIINGKKYLQRTMISALHAYTFNAYMAMQDEELWMYEPFTKREYLVIPRGAPIGYSIHRSWRQYEHIQVIVENHATVSLFGVIFKDVVVLKNITAGASSLAYFKKGIGFLAIEENGKMVGVLERNLFFNTIRP